MDHAMEGTLASWGVLHATCHPTKGIVSYLFIFRYSWLFTFTAADLPGKWFSIVLGLLNVLICNAESI